MVLGQQLWCSLDPSALDIQTPSQEVRTGMIKGGF